MTATTLERPSAGQSSTRVIPETLTRYRTTRRWHSWVRFVVTTLVLGPVVAALLIRGQGRRAAHALTCRRCRARLRAGRTALALAALALLSAGVVRATADVGGLPDCAATRATAEQRQSFFAAGGTRAADDGTRDIVRAALTWLPTGAALVYADARGADLCLARSEGVIIAHMEAGFARHGTLVGQVYLTYKKDSSGQELYALAQHEGRHIDQWAAIGSLGGPFAFPLLYGVDEAFFPGSHNHFERLAGLEDGGYAPQDDAAAPAPRLFGALISALLVVGLSRLMRHRVNADGFRC